jgi:hypothetical protein
LQVVVPSTIPVCCNCCNVNVVLLSIIILSWVFLCSCVLYCMCSSQFSTTIMVKLCWTGNKENSYVVNKKWNIPTLSLTHSLTHSSRNTDL